MIVGAKPVFHTKKFKKEMKNAEMLLWTIIDKKIYLERNPFY